MSRRAFIVVVVLLLGSTFHNYIPADPLPHRVSFESFPDSFSEWGLVSDSNLDERVASVLKPDDYMLRRYRNTKGRMAELFVAYYESQRPGSTMHSPKNCLPGSGWSSEHRGVVRVTDDPGHAPGLANQYVIQKDGRKAAVVYWYESRGRVIASELGGKAYLLWDGLRTGRRDGALVRVVVPMRDGDDERAAFDTAIKFASDAEPRLWRMLPP